MKTKNIENKVWKRGHSTYTTNIPAGLRVLLLKYPTGNHYVLDEFPVDIFPLGSIVRHDAEHYGLPLTPEEVE
jgi:hypothetical protein